MQNAISTLTMRALLSVFSAVCISVALFYLMRYMISGEVQRVDKPPSGTSVSLVRIQNPGRNRGTAARSPPPAPRPYQPPTKPPAAFLEPALAAPSPPEPPPLHTLIPELEPIVPNAAPYLGRYQNPVETVAKAASKPVQPRKPKSKHGTRTRKTAKKQPENALDVPSSPTISTASDGIDEGGSGSKTGPPLAVGSAGHPGLEDEVVPLLKLAPKYPRKAARAGKEGWVKIAFTITRNGKVTDAAVVDARPHRLFDRAALQAIRKWQFKPKVSDGRAVPRRATQVIEFKLARR